MKDAYGPLRETGTYEIFVGPDGSIWKTSTKNFICHTKHIDSVWTCLNLFPDEDVKGNKYQVTFITKDIIIVTGTINGTKENNSYQGNGYYYSADGGNNFELRNFPFNGNVRQIQIQENKIWIWSGTDLYYSTNLGKSFKNLYKHYNEGLQYLYISNNKGIAKFSSNTLYTTSDNWSTVKGIPAAFQPSKSDCYTGIRKVRIWNDLYVIEYCDGVFYSRMDSIEWKALERGIYKFEIDHQNNRLIGISTLGRVYEFISVNDFKLFSNNLTTYKINDIKVSNGKIYLLDEYDYLTLISKSEFRFVAPVMKHWRIFYPNKVDKTIYATWGANGRHLYYSENNGSTWFRAYIHQKNIEDIKIKDSNTIYLYDRDSAFVYRIKEKTLTHLILSDPLTNFAKYEIENVYISCGFINGCGGSHIDIPDFKKETDKIFATYSKNKKFLIHTDSLKKLLLEISNTANQLPSLTLIGLNYDTLKTYNPIEEDADTIRLISNYINRYKWSYDLRYFDDMDPWKFFYSKHANLFFMEIKTINNEKITIRSSAHGPYFLPFQITYKDIVFYSYDIRLSNFIKSILPPGFYGEDRF